MSTDPTVPLDPPNATAPASPLDLPAEIVTPTAPSPGGTATVSDPGPRVRWAGIVWGAVFAALAVTALVILARAESRDAIRAGILAFDPSTVGSATVWGAVVIVLGVVLLIAGGLAMLRRRRA